MIIYTPNDYRIVKYQYGPSATDEYVVERRVYRLYFNFWKFWFEHKPTRKFKRVGTYYSSYSSKENKIEIGGFEKFHYFDTLEQAERAIIRALKPYFKTKSYITTPVQEIADRWSIEFLKFIRAGQKNKENVTELRNRLEEYNNHALLDKANELLEINGKIWDLESDIRKGKEGELGLEEVGRRAIAIRDYNAERIRIKNEIQERFGEGFTEFKANHASIANYETQN
jgi:hypothetical protein